jgi:FAD-dependent urate hydroxylase
VTGHCRALIIGAGSAGLVAAIALRKAGFDPVVFEAYGRRADDAREGYLTLAVNGLDALRAIGLDDLVRGAGFPCEKIDFFNGNGRHLGWAPMGPAAADGTITHIIRRADLQADLRTEAARRGVPPVRYGKRLIGADTTAGGTVTAYFADGSTAEGDVLVGADGVHSVTRSIVDAGNPTPRYTGVGNVCGFASAAGLDLGAGPGEYRMVWGRRCTYCYTVSPQGEIWWLANPPRPDPVPRAALREMSTSDVRRLMVGLLDADRGPAAAIVRASAGPLRLSNQYAMPTVPTWHNDSMVIIGDAAHALVPASAQGCSLAIEDAVVLARCLRDAPSVAAGLTRYEEVRRPRVDRVLPWAGALRSAKRHGPVGRAVRDLVVPFILRKAASGRSVEEMSWLFCHHIEWAPA